MSDPNVPPTATDTAPPPPTDVPPVAGAMEDNKDARLWGMLAHLAALCGFLGIPLGNIIGPLVIWLIKKQEMPFVDDQGKESLNFQITMMIVALISAVLICIGIGIIMLAAVGIIDLVFVIIASVKANSGMRYRYPWAIRLIK